eukprot:CAMPEP_0114582054 /NCGR_PEP_ID=MMETSP0125-20121206/6081_1 /TAXON_ID=485358 ORGANISM="Aristerostoma sp., Strain ATCC 50986" /NCGR_SAMPLE_ID=MMETSP0125 /ASSEMBLY_ACC=CAM_ASM_000245 /LENGTH=100 /DNA_ID=CAMNT_0001774715 /DNA_START=497 /DNA_END=799 /DNA_ORIENTATION=+
MTMGLLLTDLQINLPFNMAPNIQKDLSWKFIYNVMGYELKERENQENIWLDPKDVRSGDSQLSFNGELAHLSTIVLLLFGWMVCSMSSKPTNLAFNRSNS